MRDTHVACNYCNARGGWQKKLQLVGRVKVLTMSSYFRGLDGHERARYEGKLSKVGISLQDDPYISSDKFKSDMVGWPNIEYGHIFSYLITRPGVYTLEQLLSWKQLEGYNYFKSNHVRAILSRKHGPHKDICALKAHVNPSQNSPDNAHEAWVIAKEDGTIITAHCTCMAG